jgi:hypothetical protein
MGSRSRVVLHLLIILEEKEMRFELEVFGAYELDCTQSVKSNPTILYLDISICM